MVRVELKGIAKVEAKGRTYWYAWRGGPRLRGEPGSPEFVASYNDAVEQHRTPGKSRFRFVVSDYKSSADDRKLAESTREQWGNGLIVSEPISASSASYNSTDRKRSGPLSGVGATSGRTLRELLTMACRSFPAWSPMPSSSAR